MRNILLRFDDQDELIILIDKVRKALRISASDLTKLSLYFYCNQFKEAKNESIRKQV